MEVTQLTEPVKASAEIELRFATYIGPDTHLKGLPAHVLVSSIRTTVCRAKIFGPEAGPLCSEWNVFQTSDFEIGELVPLNPCKDM